MKHILPGIVLAFMLATPAAGQQGLGVRSKPDWVIPVAYSLEVGDTTNTAGGFYFVLLNQQFNPETQEVYTEYVVKVLSEMGLTYASSINETFDPSFQKLDFHEIAVIRNGTSINKLVRNEFSLLRREENLSRQIYDGSLSAVFNIKGVNAGDVVKYSFTTRGFNPIFQNHFFRKLYLNYSNPTGKIFYRICSSPSRQLYFKNSNYSLEPEVGSLRQYKTYTWSAEDVPAFLSDESSPEWYDPYQHVEVTDFASWKELSAWANDLFKIDMRRSKALDNFIDSLKRLPDAQQRILGAVRSVQDQIRYLSFSIGISGYQPHPPSEVFDNKYGDCKDKSVLLSQVLNAIGVRSAPVLVSTVQGKVLGDRLPSPWLFNHCVVRLEHEDSTIWIDPTINFQRGDLKNTAFPAYHNGLVVGGSETELTAIPLARVPRSSHVNEDYYIDELGGDVRFEVTTEYSGSEADAVRDYWIATSQSEIDKGYMNFYANEHPGITLASPATYDDDPIKNVFTTHEKYRISSFWTYDSATAQNIARTYARFLSTYLYKPRTKIRQAPYALGSRLSIKEVIKIHVPEKWNVEDFNKTVNAHGLGFKTRWLYADKVIRLDYSLDITDDHVPPEKIAAYVKAIDDIYDLLTFEFMYTPADSANAGSSFNWPALVICIVFGIALFFGMKRMYDYDPPASEFVEQYRGIGGWLILPAIGISISPFLTMYQVYETGFFDFNQWRILMDPAYAAYDPSLGVFVIVELLVNIALIGYGFTLVLLFWHRRTSTPLLAAIFYGASFVVILSDSLVGSLFAFETEPDEVKVIVRSFVAAAIWIPYFLRSDSVKGTFTQRL